VASIAPAGRVVDLGGADWRLAPGSPDGPIAWEALADLDGWCSATVPGNVRADLIRAGRIPDLAPGRQHQASAWVDDRAWWLVRDFSVQPGAGERAHLILRGVDYVSDLFLNGEHLTRHEGMFSSLVCAVTPHVREKNRLAVRLEANTCLPTHRSSLLEKVLNRMEARFSSLPEVFPERRDVLKCQMGFGWDFSPAVRTTGIWDNVYLHLSGPVCIRDVVARSHLQGDLAEVDLYVALDAASAGRVSLRASLAGETFNCEPIEAGDCWDVPRGSSTRSLRLRVRNPHRWWPWDHGRPHLYRLQVVVSEEGEPPSDVWKGSLGLRTVSLDGWTLQINGRPVFLRGANWVPADLLPGRVEAADYEALLELARQANMNALRVWGGGLRERRAFYAACDRLGILVWQEFPFACAFLTQYPRTAEYLALVRAEAGSLVRDLRNHAALVVWCGGNEFSVRRNAQLVAALRETVKEEDPTRPFLPVSPHDQDSHFWEVWRGWEPPAVYRRDPARLASEFGLQAVPEADSLRRFIPEDELWPPGPSWTAHGAELATLLRYAAPWRRAVVGEQGIAPPERTAPPKPGAGNQANAIRHKGWTLPEFIRASQRAQAEGLKIAIEHYRRRKADGAGGALVWQLNEPWPAISWSLVDYFRVPKRGYALVRRLYTPVLISLDHPVRVYQPGDRFCPNVWLINDSADAFQRCWLQVDLVDHSGSVLLAWEGESDLPPLSAQVVARFCWTIPPSRPGKVRARVGHQDRVLSENEYDLTACDGQGPGLGRRAYANLAAWVKAL
jgi:beta-mannosidase